MIGWFRDRVRAAFEGGVENLIWVGILALLVLVSGFALDEVTLPVWLLALIVVVPLGIAWQARRRGLLPPGDVAAYVDELERQNQLYGYYANLLGEVLQTLQRAITGDLPGVTLDALVEQGILAPAREFLIQGPGEDVRLSVLVPDGRDFTMRWAAGHRLASKQQFRIEIGRSFSRHAFESGEVTWSHDVDVDPRFEPHPMAERPYRTIFSFPIRSSDEVVAVLNVVSTFPYAFRLPDAVFCMLLGGLIDVVWALGLEPDLGEGEAGRPAGELERGDDHDDR